MILSLPALVLAIMNWRQFGAQDGSFPALFMLVYVLFAVFAVVPARPEGSWIFIFDFIPFVLAIGIYVGLCRIERNTLLALIAYGSLIGTVLSFSVGAYQVFELGQIRANGVGGSAIYYANISLLLGFLSLAPLFSAKGWRWFFALGPVLGVAAAILSGSRSMIPVGSVLALTFAVHMALKYRTAQHAGVWRISVLLFVGMVGAVAAVLVLSDDVQVVRIASTFDQAAKLLKGEDVGDNSLAFRFDFYASGITAFQNAPWTGYGWHEAFNAAAPFMGVYDPARDTAGAVRHLHNDLINFAVSFGIPGVVAYLLALAAPLASWWRNRARVGGYGSYCAFGVALSFVAMGLTDTNFVYEAPKVMFCFTAAGAAALAARRASE